MKSDQTPEAFEFEVHPAGTLQLSKNDPDVDVKDEEAAEEETERLQKRLFAAQVKTFLAKRTVVFVFEGWDAAGKGGAIRHLTALMDPRGYKVWPIAAPREHERAHHYLWRFSSRLPERGEIAIFDRSWYGRVLVERVEKFASPAEWKRAYDEINAFERTLTADGILMAKFWLHIDKKTQLERFRAREKDPVKRFKIGPDDWRNRRKWPAYEKAVQDAFDRTHRADAPWHLISANHKRYARLAIMRECLRVLESGERSRKK